MNIESLWTWVNLGGVLAFLVLSVVTAWRLHPPGRRGRLSRYARRKRWHFDPVQRRFHGLWLDLPCLHLFRDIVAENVLEGERRGRRFASFDCQYSAPGPPNPVANWGGSLRSSSLGSPSATFGSFSAIVVEQPLPPTAKTSPHRRAMAPLHVEFGAEASVVRNDDGLLSPEEIDRAIEGLNAVLDQLVRDAPA